MKTGILYKEIGIQYQIHNVIEDFYINQCIVNENLFRNLKI